MCYKQNRRFQPKHGQHDCIIESRILTKCICKCKCRFDGKNVIQINGGITVNADVSVKSVMHVKKIVFSKIYGEMFIMSLKSISFPKEPW